MKKKSPRQRQRIVCGAGGFETYGGGILVVVEDDAAIPGVSGPQRGVSSGWLPMLLLAEA